MSANGGPAFPTERHDHHEGLHWVESGMTLREWYAGQALAGLLVNAKVEVYTQAQRYEAFRIVADTAYGIADAMIAAREDAS